MRKLLFTLIAAVPLMAQSAPAPQTNQQVPPAPTGSRSAPWGLTVLAPQAGEDANAKKGRELLQKMIAKLGGETYLNFQTMTQTGRSYQFYQGQPNSVGTQFWRFYRYPDKERLELTKQRDVIYVTNGDKGYEITYKGTAAQEDEQFAEALRRRDHSLEIVLRQWLKDPKTLVFYEGPGTANQKMVEMVSILNAKNEQVSIAIDPNDMLPVQRTYTYRNPTDKLKDVEGEVYANYRQVAGIMTPHSVSRTKNGLMTNQRFINEVQYNVPIADSQFEARVTYDPYKRSGKRP